MPDYVPISQERHAGKGWIKPADFSFALTTESVPVVVDEMLQMAAAMPIGFVQQQKAFVPVALMGIGKGRNVFVTRSGKWLGGYVPAVLRAHPFRLASTENDTTILCFDEASGLLAETPDDANPFFDDTRQPSPPVQSMMKLLAQLERSRQETLAAMQVLGDMDLMQPWPLRHDIEGRERLVSGLFQIDHQALKSLSLEATGRLHGTRALEISYCHLVSRTHVALMSQLSEAHDKREEALNLRARSLFEISDDGDFEIDWSKLNSSN